MSQDPFRFYGKEVINQLSARFGESSISDEKDKPVNQYTDYSKLVESVISCFKIYESKRINLSNYKKIYANKSLDENTKKEVLQLKNDIILYKAMIEKIMKYIVKYVSIFNREKYEECNSCLMQAQYDNVKLCWNITYKM
jgi:hypothetical protein